MISSKVDKTGLTKSMRVNQKEHPLEIDTGPSILDWIHANKEIILYLHENVFAIFVPIETLIFFDKNKKISRSK